MIDKLTDSQIARFAEFRDKWLAIGLSTEPANREKAEAAIVKSYHCAGLPAPKKIVWCDSPLSQGLTRAIVIDSVGASVRASVRDSVWASVGASVRDSVRASVRASVGASVRDSVGASVGASVRDSVRDSVWASVGASVRDSVGASVRDSVWASVGASVGASVYGQQEAGWLSFYDYFREVTSLRDQTEKLTGLIEQSKHAGWFLPHVNICWVSERHHILRLDEQGRLHSLAGPAVQYPDGWSIYAVNGVRVPEYVVETPQSITIKNINDEQNNEVRRVMMERMGWEKYLKQSGAKVINKRRNDRDTQQEKLYELPDGSKRFECVDPSTGRKYFLGVPRDVTTCEQTQLAISHGLDRYSIHRS